MRKSKKLAVIGVLTVLGLVGGLFVGLTLAKADDVRETNLGYREFTILHNGNAANGQMSLRLYGTKLDSDGDDDNDSDKHRAVGRSYKIQAVKRILINKVRLQRRNGAGEWVTVASVGPKNSGNANSSVSLFNSPPPAFNCGSHRYRVQADGLVRWADGDLNAFGGASDTWRATGSVTTGPDNCKPI